MTPRLPVPSHARPLRRIRARLRAFAGGTQGSVSVEAILMFPMLLWAFVATFVFFDAFRSQSVNIKAAYTIGDTLSREPGYVTPAYLDSLYDLQEFLTDTDEARQLRVTMFRYEADGDRYRVNWSRDRGGMGQLDDTQLATLRDRLPVMPDGEAAILVQTAVDYRPLLTSVMQFGILNAFTFQDLVVTRPRFAPQLCWNPVENGTDATSIC